MGMNLIPMQPSISFYEPPFLSNMCLEYHWINGMYDLLTLNSFSVAGNESCPQPQTSEHLAAVEIMKLKHILILQNKIDLVKESQAKEQYEQILAFVKGGRGNPTSLCFSFC